MGGIFKQCGVPGCPGLVPRDSAGRRYCEKHAEKEAAEGHRHNERSEPRDPFYGTMRWRRKSDFILRRDPVCQKCQVALSECADHIVPRKLRPDLAWDDDNLQGLCSDCHNRKRSLERAEYLKRSREG